MSTFIERNFFPKVVLPYKDFFKNSNMSMKYEKCYEKIRFYSNQLKRKELGETLTYLDPAFGNKDRGNIRGLFPNLVPCDSNLGERNFECSFLRFCARLLTQIHCRPIFCPNLVLQVCSGDGGTQRSAKQTAFALLQAPS